MGHKAYVTAAVGAWLAWFGPATAEDSVWGSREVAAFVKSARDAVKSDDPFAPLPAVSAAVGQRFRFTINSRSGDERGHSPDGNTFAWTYDRAAQSIRFWTSPGFVARSEWIVDDPQFYEVARNISAYNAAFSKNETDGGVRSNAYGASARTKIIETDAYGVMVVGPTYGADGLPRREGHSFDVVIPASPDEGRRLSRDMRLVVEGTIQELPDGQIVKCAESYSGATIDSPTVLMQDFCYANAEIDRIAFIDSSDQSVKAEWTK